MKLTQDLFEVRFLIEPQMASLAAQHITDKEVAVLERLEKALKKKSIRMEIFTLNWIFNFIVRLLRLGRNVAMQQLIPIIIQSIKLYNDFFTSEQKSKYDSCS